MVLVTLLLVIACMAFLFSRSHVNERVNLTLTVYLGVIFFQILVVERLPPSPTMTVMHMFMFLSSLMLMLLCLFHLLIWLLDSYLTRKRAQHRAMQRWQRSDHAIEAVIKLQRAWRRRRILKHAEAPPRIPQSAGGLRRRNTVAVRRLPLPVVARAPSARGEPARSAMVGGEGSEAPLGIMRAGLYLEEMRRKERRRRLVLDKLLWVGRRAMLHIDQILAAAMLLLYLGLVLGVAFFYRGTLDERCSDPWST